ncbi:hypothetical protein CRUP_032569 [Coryphaenoides rupestris]|nr:hypothetical protein CRUP_032569 [Coryphaenoides rupestris]
MPSCPPTTTTTTTATTHPPNHPATERHWQSTRLDPNTTTSTSNTTTSTTSSTSTTTPFCRGQGSRRWFQGVTTEPFAAGLGNLFLSSTSTNPRCPKNQAGLKPEQRDHTLPLAQGRRGA